ncbi:MAG: 3-dehydroquinate dehydratase [Lachnospiraceae bacterium]|nr:3-dehydroquinate dehydratase [Lachnospiraceae bacterium]
MNILVLNGPNLNFLGIREPEVYGSATYEDLAGEIEAYAENHGHHAAMFQTNHEGVIIDRLQDAYADGTEGIIINPGAYSHYSYAIHDALKTLSDIPKVEVHLSDIRERKEAFRHTSVTADACDHVIMGKGAKGYFEAFDWLEAHAKRP